MIIRASAVLLITTACAVIAPAASAESARASARNANYTISVTFDPDARRLEGSERVRWRNTSRAATGELRFYLGYNARRSRSTTWMQEAATGGADLDALGSSRVDLVSLRTAGSNDDLLAGATFVAPDDGNAEDRSVLRVNLAEPLAAGGEIALDVHWTATPPHDAGGDGLFLFTHWFPQVGVLSEAGWIAHQFHLDADVYTDYGVYDVSIDLPAGWQAAATGREQPPPPPAEGRQTRRFVQADVRDFAWVMSRDWIEHRLRLDRLGASPIDIRLLMRPEHARQAARLAAATARALIAAESSFASYPYDDLTIVDVPWRNPYAPLVFPTLATVTTRWLEPALASDGELAVADVVARHFWQQVIGSDPVAYPWMGQGFSAYAADRLSEYVVASQLDSTIGLAFRVERLFGQFIPYVNRSVRVPRVATGDDSSRRIALWLRTLERHLGWPTLEASLIEYTQRFQFGHPTPADFSRVVETASGRDLGWFLSQAFEVTFDYGVGQVTAESKQTAGAPFRTTVVIRRYGNAIFPGTSQPRVGPYQSGRGIEVAMRFADGTVRDEYWDGRDQSTAFVYDSVTPLASVQVDPRRTLLLDVKRTNNTWTRTPRAQSAANQWSARWMIWLEDLLLDCGFFV